MLAEPRLGLAHARLTGILAAVATVLGVAFTIYKTAHDRQVRDLREQLGQKDRRIETLEREGPEGLRLLNEQLQTQLNEAQADLERLRADYAAADDVWQTQLLTLRQQDDRLRETVESLTKTLEEAREDILDHHAEGLGVDRVCEVDDDGEETGKEYGCTWTVTREEI